MVRSPGGTEPGPLGLTPENTPQPEGRRKRRVERRLGGRRGLNRRTRARAEQAGKETGERLGRRFGRGRRAPRVRSDDSPDTTPDTGRRGRRRGAVDRAPRVARINREPDNALKARADSVKIAVEKKGVEDKTKAAEAARKVVIDNSLTFAPVAGVEVEFEGVPAINVPNPKREAVALRTRIEGRETRRKELRDQHEKVGKERAALDPERDSEESFQALEKRAAEIREALRKLSGERGPDEQRIKELTSEQARRQKLVIDESRMAAYVAGGAASEGRAPEIFTAQLDDKNAATDLSSYLHAMDVMLEYRSSLTENAGKTLTQSVAKALGIPPEKITISTFRVTVADWPHEIFAADKGAERQAVWKIFRDVGEQSNAESLKQTVAQYLAALEKNAGSTNAALSIAEKSIGDPARDTAVMRKNVKAFAATLGTEEEYINDARDTSLWTLEEVREPRVKYIGTIKARRARVAELEKRISDVEASQGVDKQISTAREQLRTIQEGFRKGGAGYGALKKTYQDVTRVIDTLGAQTDLSKEQVDALTQLRKSEGEVQKEIAEWVEQERKKAEIAKEEARKAAEKLAADFKEQARAAEVKRVANFKTGIDRTQQRIAKLNEGISKMSTDGEWGLKNYRVSQADFNDLLGQLPTGVGDDEIKVVQELRGTIEKRIGEFKAQIARLTPEVEAEREKKRIAEEKIAEDKRLVEEAAAEKVRVATLRTRVQGVDTLVEDIVDEMATPPAGDPTTRRNGWQGWKDRLIAQRALLPESDPDTGLDGEIQRQRKRIQDRINQIDPEIESINEEIKKKREADEEIENKRREKERIAQLTTRIDEIEGAIKTINVPAVDESDPLEIRIQTRQSRKKRLQQQREALAKIESTEDPSMEQRDRITKKKSEIDKQIDEIDVTIKEWEKQVNEAVEQVEDIYRRYRNANQDLFVATTDVLRTLTDADARVEPERRQRTIQDSLPGLQSELVRKEVALGRIAPAALKRVQEVHIAELAKITKALDEVARKLTR